MDAGDWKMRRIGWLSCWPGLAALWLRGSLGGLATATAFAAALNFALITTFVWPHLLFGSVSPWVTPAGAWVLVLWFWIIAARSAARIIAQDAAHQVPPNSGANRLFTQAQTEYLKGHISQAERLLKELLAANPGDCEARLLLATLCRRANRPQEAGKYLTDLIELPKSQTWRMEIEVEQQHIREFGREDEASAGGIVTPSRAAA